MTSADPDTALECAEHGHGRATFICRHLAHGAGRGFHTAGEAIGADAWCEHCNLILEHEGAWTDAAAAYAKIIRVCEQCWVHIRDRNLCRPNATTNLAFRCHYCGKFHDGAPRDFGFDAPCYWHAATDDEKAAGRLSTDVCVLGEDHFVRAVLHLPVLSAAPLALGVWVSLSKVNFERYHDHWSDPKRFTEPPYFGWFSNRLDNLGYPDTQNLKCDLYQLPGNLRPWIELERNDHPLSTDYWEGLTEERSSRLMHHILHTRG